MKTSGHLGPRDRRALLWGALLLVPALAGNFFLRPYVRARETLRARIAEQRDLLSRELALMGTAGKQRDDLQLVGAILEQQRVHLFASRDPLAATAALVGVVGERARRQGFELESLESRPAERMNGGLVGVRIEASARGDLEALLRWLHALESDARLLRVEWLIVSQGAETTDSATVEQLRITAGVQAFVRNASEGP